MSSVSGTGENPTRKPIVDLYYALLATVSVNAKDRSLINAAAIKCTPVPTWCLRKNKAIAKKFWLIQHHLLPLSAVNVNDGGTLFDTE